MNADEIVKRLREAELRAKKDSREEMLFVDAADIIERQAKALEEAEKALEPFAVIKGNYSAQTDILPLGCGFAVSGDVRFHFTVGDMRRAEIALATIRAARGERDDG